MADFMEEDPRAFRAAFQFGDQVVNALAGVFRDWPTAKRAFRHLFI